MSTPPRAARAFLALCLPRGGVRESVLGDLEEMHAARAADPAVGPRRAALWYRVHAARVGLAYLWRRIRGTHPAVLAPELTVQRTGGEVMGDVVRDFRFALRSFARTPGFFAMALTTLALGVGANAAVFSVLNGLYLRPLPFEEPDRLVQVGQSMLDGSSRMNAHTAGTWVDWRDRQTSFEAFAGYRFWTTTVERGDAARRILSIHSLGSIFDVLGAEAMLGRTFTAAEEGPGAERLVVLSHPFWRREYGEENPVGRSLLIGGVPHTVLGVMPPSFRFPTPAADLWKTSDLSAAELQDRDDHFASTLGRLAPGVTLEQAQAAMDAIHAGIREAHPDKTAGTRPELVPLHEFLVAGVGRLWGTLMGSVAFVLLIACLNLANLLLSRAAAREGEIALRRALGASRRRLVRLMCAESAVLAAAGAVVGLGAGWLFLEGILAWMPGAVPRIEAVEIDARVLGFTLAVAGLAGLASGLLPALQLTRASVGERIRRARPGGRGLRIRQGLVMGEIALAVVLVSGSGLLLRDYAAMSALDPGFAVDGRTSFYVEVQGEDRTDGVRFAFYEELERAVLRLPGVRAAGLSSRVPMTGFTPGAWVGEPGLPVPQGEDHPTVRYVGVSPSYLETMGIPLLRGRDLDADDGRDGTPSLLLSESAAARLFPGQEALGQRIYLGPDGLVAPVSTVVGIVGDVRQNGMARDAPAMAYVPQESLSFWRGFDLVLRTDGAAAGLAEEVRRVARALDPSVLVLQPRSLEDVLGRAVVGQRNTMLLFGLLGAVALVLAVVGVFGVVAFLVSRRTREIGIRIAVGAGRGEVQALVLRGSLVPIGLGAALGVASALALARLLEQGLVAGTSPTDPLTFLSVPALLVGVAMLAAWLPARRASRVDPVRALAGD